MDRRELEKWCNNPKMYWSDLKKWIAQQLDYVPKGRRRDFILNSIWPTLRSCGLFDRSIIDEMVRSIYCTTAYDIGW